MNHGRLKVALLGMYGGMWREYNPGCFMICRKTIDELSARLPGSTISVYSVDNKGNYKGLLTEEACGVKINFFSKAGQLDLLENRLSQYDALVLGGDIIWGGDDVVDDNEIFFLQSDHFLNGTKPVVLFNAVHTFYTDEGIAGQKHKFQNAAKRAAYVAVRTKAIRERLTGIGITQAEWVPDPVLDLNPATLTAPKDIELGAGAGAGRPVLGLSIRKKLSKNIIEALERINLEAYRVVVFPYSRQYDNLGTVNDIKTHFGNRFAYIEEYGDPAQTYRLIGRLDYFINDTYHGIMASIIYGKPFISLDVEEEVTSRKHQLLDTVGIDQRFNIRLRYGDPSNVAKLVSNIPTLLTAPRIVDNVAFMQARARIRRHYDRMAEIILAHAPAPCPVVPKGQAAIAWGGLTRGADR